MIEVSQFVIDVVEGFESDPDWPNIRVTINGEDFWPREGNVGYDPGGLLKFSSPLLPSETPRRIAIYRCSCGIPGCGSLAPLISADDTNVYWTDTRDFVGVFEEPDDPSDGIEGSKVSVPDFVFNRGNYEAEIRRASADTNWLTPNRRAGQMIAQKLLARAHHFENMGLQFEWAVVKREKKQTMVSFKLDEPSVDDPRSYQKLTTLEASGSPEEIAVIVFEFLSNTNPAEWPAPRFD